MGKVIVVASGKGGTGKTSFCAGLAVALCAQGERVLLIDADAGLRSLDLVLGMSQLLYSYADVAAGTVSLKEAAGVHPVVKNLRVRTAPAAPDGACHLTQAQFAALIQIARAQALSRQQRPGQGRQRTVPAGRGAGGSGHHRLRQPGQGPGPALGRRRTGRL